MVSDFTAGVRGALPILLVVYAAHVGTNQPLQADDGMPVGVAARLDGLIDQKIREAGAEPAPESLSRPTNATPRQPRNF